MNSIKINNSPKVNLSFTKLNYGCGYDKKIGYLNVDIEEACKPDFLLVNGDITLLPKFHYDEIYAKDVLEHIPRQHSLKVLLEFSSLLKNNGCLKIQTTSIFHVAKKMEENPNFADHFGWTICLFGNQAHVGDFHLTGFTELTLAVHLEAAGFKIKEKSLVDGWMFHYECEKYDAWDFLISNPDGGSLSDLEFISAAYDYLFKRDLDKQGEVHFLNQLKLGISRRDVLLDIASRPERLYVVARKLGI
jgi:hypothetical protein